MKKRLLLKLILSFVLLIGSSITQAQDMINPLEIPKPSKSMPPWAKLLYVTPLNVNNVTAAFDAYYRNHPLPVEGKGKGQREGKEKGNEHEKNYVLYYYRLKMFTRNAVKEDGTLKSAQEMKNDQVLSEDRDETKPDIWFPLNAETYWPANDDPNNAMVDEQANVYCFDVYSDSTDIAYAGTETGGLYKTTDKGREWKQISKDQNFNALSAIAIKPDNSNVVFVGDNQAIYKTSDGGEKWNAVLEVDDLGVNAIEISPLDPIVVLVATNKGIFRSPDAGKSWEIIKSQASTDIAINPKDPNVVYAVLQKKDSTFYECWKSVDQGKTFKRKKKGWPTKYTGGEAVIGLTAADTSTIYIAMLAGPEESAIPILVKSTNGGDNWKTVAVGNNKEESSAFPLDRGQGFYDFIILVSPTNENHVIVGTTESYKSINGGKTFECLSECDEAPLRIHADLQAAKAIGEESWISSDGGITYSTDFFTTESISRVKGLNGSEWWGMAAGWNRDIIVGGLYHNGDVAYSEMYDNKTLRVGGGESATGYMNPFFDRNTYFSDIEEDGQQLPTSISEEIVSIPQLSMFPNERNEEMGSGEVEWDPRYASVFYLGKDNVFYKTTNNGAEFKPLHTFKKGTEILQFEISRSNPDVIYVVERDIISDRGEEDGRIWKTPDGGLSWSEITTIPKTSNNERNYMAITMSATDDDEVWVALKNGSEKNKVFKTPDGGLTWSNLTTPKIKNLKVASIMHQMGTDGGVYVGGSNGKIYYKNNQLSDWESFSKGLPVNYSASFLKPFYRDNKIRTGGIGGLWEATLYENSAPIAQPMVDKESGTSCPADTFYFDSYSVLPAGATFFWSFPGAAYVSSPTIRNPKVVYTPGKHSVTLTVSYRGITDTDTVDNLVTVTKTANTPPTPTITKSGSVLRSSSTRGNQWYLDGQLLPGATDQSYIANEKGKYTVIVTKNGCVSAASKPAERQTVETDEVVNPNQLSIYPNPSNGHFTVEFNSSTTSAYTLQIENALGQVIYKEEIEAFKGSFTKLLNVGEGMSGVYTLRLSNGQSTTVRKVIVH